METLSNGEIGAAKLTDVIYLATHERWDEARTILSKTPNNPEFLGWAEVNLGCLDEKISRLAHLIIDYSKQSLNGEEK